MDDVLLVQELKRQKRLSDNLNRFTFGECSVAQCFIKVFSFEQFLNYEEVLTVLEYIEHPDDVRVPRVHQHFELINQKVVKSGLLAQ